MTTRQTGRSFGAVPALALAFLALPLTSHPTEVRGQTFRSSVDLIALDVQVRDKDGRALRTLTAGSFEVTLDGRPRRVVSADFVNLGDGDVPIVSAGAPAAPPAPAIGSSPALPGRTFVIAVDAGSFRTPDARIPALAAQRFIQGLRPDDRVAIFTVPVGPRLPATTEHAQARLALGKVAGRKRELKGDFEFTPAEVIDLTSVIASKGDRDLLLDDPLIRQHCTQSTDLERDSCLDRLLSEVDHAATGLEQDALEGIKSLDALLGELRNTPERKTVLLLSGGMPMADNGNGRPNLGNALKTMGEQAAYANATVHVIYFNSNDDAAFSVDSRRSRPSTVRTKSIDTRALAQFSQPSGGLLLTSEVGAGEAEMERLLADSAAYYVLGVEPDARDRDGRPHRVEVKLKDKGAEVRSRQLVLVPRPAPSR
jgi:VWFA-related protein